MELKKKRKLHRSISLIGAVALVVVLGLWLTGSGWMRRMSYDMVLGFLREAPPTDIVIVTVDERYFKEVGQLYVDRRHHAALLGILKEDGAKMVFYDVFFDEERGEEEDGPFADAIEAFGGVILGGSLIRKNEEGQDLVEVLPPNPDFRRRAAAWGLLEQTLDPDHAVRRIYPGTDRFPPSTWKAAEMVVDDIEAVAGGGYRRERWIRYYDLPGSTRSVSIYTALTEDGVPKGFFRDKYVFVGGRYAVGEWGESKDNFVSPFVFWSPVTFSEDGGSDEETAGAFFDGVEIHANIFDNLRKGNFLVRADPFWETTGYLAYGVLLTLLLAMMRPLLAFLVSALAGLGTAVVLCLMIRNQGVLYSWLVPVSLTGAAFLWCLGAHYYIEVRRKLLLKRALAGYISPVIAERMVEDELEITQGGESRDLTIVFTDLEGFTSLSETLDPEALCELLRSYFNVSTENIFKADGTVLSFIGDAILAVWGAPVPELKQADKAARAALGLVRETTAMEFLGRHLRTRVGINSGRVAVGNYGSDTRFNYTVFGDNVNLASRLEGLNNFLGTDILMAESAWLQLDQGFRTRHVGAFFVKGKATPTQVYELFGDSETFPQYPAWAEHFNDGYRHYCRRQFDEAKRFFKQAESARGGKDGASAYYLGEIAEIESGQKPLEEGWAGEIRLTKKG